MTVKKSAVDISSETHTACHSGVCFFMDRTQYATSMDSNPTHFFSVPTVRKKNF